jgi:hypothetical protein
VVEGETGTYYAESTPASLAEAVAAFDPASVDPATCVAAAQRFGTERFQASLRAIVAEAVLAERAPRPDGRVAAGGLLRRTG